MSALQERRCRSIRHGRGIELHSATTRRIAKTLIVGVKTEGERDADADVACANSGPAGVGDGDVRGGGKDRED